MRTIYWKINKLEVIPENGNLTQVIQYAHYQRIASEGEHSSFIEGKMLFPLPESSNFIPYENITEEDIISWILPNIDLEKVDLFLNRKLDSIMSESAYFPPLPF
jgi:beta-glucanase (GH16 family)